MQKYKVKDNELIQGGVLEGGFNSLGSPVPTNNEVQPKIGRYLEHAGNYVHSNVMPTTNHSSYFNE